MQESVETLAAKHVTTGNREDNVAEEGRLHPDPLVTRGTRQFSISMESIHVTDGFS